MIEIIFLVSFGLLMFHFFRIFNNEFNLPYAIVIFISQLIMLGLFISLTAITQDLKVAVMTRFITLFVIIELILLIVEVLYNLGYIVIKSQRKKVRG